MANRVQTATFSTERYWESIVMHNLDMVNVVASSGPAGLGSISRTDKLDQSFKIVSKICIRFGCG